jgi:hypothetical protein
LETISYIISTIAPTHNSYLGGYGGTGKTEVIKSILALSISWRCREQLLTTFQAYAYKGVTLHTLIGIAFKSKSSTADADCPLKKPKKLCIPIIGHFSYLWTKCL